MNNAVFIREITPQDMKLEVECLGADEIQAMARYLGGVVGHAHGRQMEGQDWRSWRAELGRKEKPDAPSWLWSSVVELLSIHDQAYLDHCRRFALAHH